MKELKALVQQFHRNIDEYKSGGYDEENTKIDYIDRFFAFLGWDVNNNQGYSEDYREVVREDKVIIKGRPKSPDYSFRIGKERLFFVEAKKPSVNIYDDIKPAFQVRRYGYSAGLPISILTDFEEFAIYDTTIPPKENDKASTARIFYCKYDEYENNWDFLFNTISKDAVLKGKFKQFTKKGKKKKGTQSVDKELLKMIENWREMLAKNIALRNMNIDIYQLNEAVQKIIDRIIFLRMAEDRNTERYATLAEIIKNDTIYHHLARYFNSANKKYNSGLFKPIQWLDNLSIDDKVFKTIIADLYYPNPYEFSVIPIEILGHIYEQFLGKTIRLTKGHRAVIEEKPEVRKAGGVYYTPKYIVDYIVQNTVGRKLGVRTQDSGDSTSASRPLPPASVAKLKILDPACGSGSFLVGAYKYLLEYHLKYWTQSRNKKKGLKEGHLYLIGKDSYRLTTKTKRSILLNNIYGVDIDTQAVEVTKLSLLLTMMEGEIAEAGTELFFKGRKEALLPDLSANIKCGNSLIASDFYTGKDLELFDSGEMKNINAFDWDVEFKEIMDEGGFDAVIGNPPYVEHKKLRNFSNYFATKYLSYAGTADLYIYFIEKGIKVLKKRGYMSFVISNKFMKTEYGKKIRTFLNDKTILEVIDFTKYHIFDALVSSCILLVENIQPTDKHYIRFSDIDKKIKSYGLTNFINKYGLKVKQSSLKPNYWIFKDQNLLNIKEKMETNTIKINEIDGINIYRGITTGFNPAFIINDDIKKMIISKDNDSNLIIHPLIQGRNIKRWVINKSNNYIINTNYDLNIPADYPIIFQYLQKYAEKLKIRSDQGRNWWNLRACKYYHEFEREEKIVWGLTSDRWAFAYDNEKYYLPSNGYLLTSKTFNIKYLLGVINSNLMKFYFSFIGIMTAGGAYTLKHGTIKQLPIKTIDFSNKAEKAQHDKMVTLVEQMQEAQKAVHDTAGKSESEIKFAKQRCDLLDKQIDALVYELYDLTEEEIKIVEGK